MIEVLESFGPRVNAITHTAPHHADEVFATVMLAALSDVVLYRTRDKSIIDSSDAIVYDVGGEFDPKRKRFDHHQKNFSESRRDGIKYSSAGLIWREYGVEIVKKLSGELRRSGLVLDDEEMIRAWEKDPEQMYIPLKKMKNGGWNAESIASAGQMGKLYRHVRRTIASMASELRAGAIEADPYFRSQSDRACENCDFFKACRFTEGEGGENSRCLKKLKADEVWKLMSEEGDNDE